MSEVSFDLDYVHNLQQQLLEQQLRVTALEQEMQSHEADARRAEELLKEAHLNMDILKDDYAVEVELLRCQARMEKEQAVEEVQEEKDEEISQLKQEVAQLSRALEAEVDDHLKTKEQSTANTESFIGVMTRACDRYNEVEKEKEKIQLDLEIAIRDRRLVEDTLREVGEELKQTRWTVERLRRRVAYTDEFLESEQDLSRQLEKSNEHLSRSAEWYRREMLRAKQQLSLIRQRNQNEPQKRARESEVDIDLTLTRKRRTAQQMLQDLEHRFNQWKKQ
jgi:hypothetical protein